MGRGLGDRLAVKHGVPGNFCYYHAIHLPCWG
jgi:hypothetical protein